MIPIDIYNDLHKLAEPPLAEVETSKYLKQKLTELGFTISATVQTGIIAEYDSGVAGPTIGLRADMDALRYEINGAVQYRHNCGHDANMTMVLTAAQKTIAQGIKRGKLVLIFQPAEEIVAGAKLMAESGKIPQLDALYGIHLRPIAETPLGEATPALIHGASRMLRVKITGKNAHGARPHLGVNAIETAILAINAINAIKVDPRVSHSVKVTVFKGGDVDNIIPAEAEFSLDIRAQSNPVMEVLYQKIKAALDGSCAVTGATYQIVFDEGCLAAIYDEGCIAIAKKAIEQVLGKAKQAVVTPGGEDFHYYAGILGVKAAYIGVGADLQPGLHAVDMDFDKKALTIGRDILSEVLAISFKEGSL